MNDELQRKVDRAIKLLQSAEVMAKKVGQPVEICYSGGKDSDVILELAKMSGIDFKGIYKNTTIDPPGTIKHAREMGCEVMQPEMNFQEIIADKGMPNRWRRFADIVEQARLYILTDCGGSFERFAEWGLLRPLAQV